MIYTRDAAGFELSVGNKVMCVKKVYHDDVGLSRPTLVEATISEICPKMIVVTDGSKWFRIYPDQCVKVFTS